MSQASTRLSAGDPHNSPVYWFVLLQRARERADVVAALQAQRELSRLGVQIEFQNPEEPLRDS